MAEQHNECCSKRIKRTMYICSICEYLIKLVASQSSSHGLANHQSQLYNWFTQQHIYVHSIIHVCNALATLYNFSYEYNDIFHGCSFPTIWSISVPSRISAPAPYFLLGSGNWTFSFSDATAFRFRLTRALLFLSASASKRALMA